jgi:hypothetical protein
MKIFKDDGILGGLANKIKEEGKDYVKDKIGDGLKMKHEVSDSTKNIIYVVIAVVVLYIFVKKKK